MDWQNATNKFAHFDVFLLLTGIRAKPTGYKKRITAWSIRIHTGKSVLSGNRELLHTNLAACFISLRDGQKKDKEKKSALSFCDPVRIQT